MTFTINTIHLDSSMEILLKNNFTSHYGLSISSASNIYRQTNISYFELQDDAFLIYQNFGEGVAKYKNIKSFTVNVINYEAFINSLPSTFQLNREKCDLIVYTDEKQYFLLNELTDTLPKYVNPFTNNQGLQIGKRVKAISQLLNTLTDLMSVPSINSFANSYTVKHCCFFNKQSVSPPLINASAAFNRINTIAINGIKMVNAGIESFDFELYEYSGSQIYTL